VAIDHTADTGISSVGGKGGKGRATAGQWLRVRSVVGIYPFVLPAFILYGVFALYPGAASVILSFFKWDIGLRNVEFRGLDNYWIVLTDGLFWQAIRNNLILLLLAVVIPVGVGLVLAVLLASIPWGRTFFRAILFLPAIFSGVVVAYVWGWIFHPQTGLLNTLLDTVGLEFLKLSWLGNPTLALYAVFLAYAWASYGYSMVIFLAGLQSIDPMLYEAAVIDGANALQRFRHITIPGLHDTFTFVITLRIISSIGIFAIVFILTGGGPYFATMVLEVYVYGLLSEFRWGVASAAATFQALIVMILTFFFMRQREREV